MYLRPSVLELLDSRANAVGASPGEVDEVPHFEPGDETLDKGETQTLVGTGDERDPHRRARNPLAVVTRAASSISPLSVGTTAPPSVLETSTVMRKVVVPRHDNQSRQTAPLSPRRSPNAGAVSLVEPAVGIRPIDDRQRHAGIKRDVSRLRQPIGGVERDAIVVRVHPETVVCGEPSGLGSLR